MAFSLEEFIGKTLDLLEKERDAEIAETKILQENVPLKELQRRGICLLKLRLSSQHTGLYGRSVLVFETYWPGKEMPSHSFTPGDIAGLSLSSSEGSSGQITSGIVSKVTQSSVSVAFEESFDTLSLDDQAQYKLLKLANDVTYRRLKRALTDLNSYSHSANFHLVNVLFGDSELSPPLSTARDGSLSEVAFLNTGLDASQRDAVQFALNQRELAIIHGPPGTGKTTTVVEIIQQLINRKLKVLACAPSNIAVDNLVERLALCKSRVVRLGHPARLLSSIQQYALDAILASSDETKLVKDVRNDMDKTLSKMKKSRDRGEKQKLREDMRSLRRELREREKAAVTHILQHADVVLATLTGASGDGPLKHLGNEHFDVVIIDECSQSLEAACWIALMYAPKCILAGDHNQLPPTILSHEAAKGGLEITLMERLLKLHGDAAMRMLTVQYRMNDLIMKWSSEQLYEGRLVSHQSVEKHLLRDLPSVEDNDDTSTALLLIDTAGCELNELDLPEEVSKGNEGEADLVAAHVNHLIKSGLSANDIAIIAPYNLQVDLLRLRLSSQYPHLEIKSVDGFQGREKEAVVISLVRSNAKGEVGFLAENRRINVAITRARRHLAVICDSETVSHHDFLKSLVEYLTENGEVRSAQQYIDDGALAVHTDRPDYLDDHLDYSAQNQAGKHAAESSARPKTHKTTPKYPPSSKPKESHKGKDSGMKRDVPQKPHRTEEEDMSMKQALESDLKMFVSDSSRDSYAFPPSLNSYQRMCVHSIAEKLGLSHASQGEGSERHIVVSKIGPASRNDSKKKKPPGTVADEKSNESQSKLPIKMSHGAQNQSDQTSQKSHDQKHQSENLETEPHLQEPPAVNDSDNKSEVSDPHVRVCEGCGKSLPKANYDLHILRCDKNSPASSGAVPKSAKNKKKKAKAASKGEKLNAELAEDIENFDELVNEAIEDNSKCHFPKCKNNAATLGQNCPFCRKRFCLTHFIAEAHGCGDKAKEQARAQISRDGVLHRGSGVPDKKPSASKRAHLERKLEAKITEMTEKRKNKKKTK